LFVDEESTWHKSNRGIEQNTFNIKKKTILTACIPLNDKDSDGDVNNIVTLRQDSGHVTFYFRIPLFHQNIE
jgi:hypothetical protein